VEQGGEAGGGRMMEMRVESWRGPGKQEGKNSRSNFVLLAIFKIQHAKFL
jgi:hypothetical protein